MINGERVKQARELRGWTQTDLARRIGKTQSSIAQIEGGLYGASDELVDAIARETNLPLAFFEKETAPEFSLGSLKFCAHPRTTKREMLEAYRNAQITYEMWSFLCSRFSRIAADLHKLTEEPVESARRTRHSLGLSPDEPVPHLINILEHHGTLVLAFPALSKREAFSLWANDTPIIAIADGRPGDRLRITCAHELGHLVMDSKKLMFKVNDSEADIFAAEFLMPTKAMRRELKPPLTLTLLGNLKAKWKVPIRALICRSEDLHIITERQHRYLLEQMTVNGWKEIEPVALRPERPRGLRQLAEVLYGSPIDCEKLAADVCLTPKMAEDIIALYAPRKSRATQEEEQDLPVRPRVVRLRSPGRK